MNVVSFAFGLIMGLAIVGSLCLLQYLAYTHPRFYFGKRAYYKHLLELKRLREQIGKEHPNEFDD